MNRREEEFWTEYYSEQEFANSDSLDYGCSVEELKQVKRDLMIEALFGEKFEPIDEETLQNDLALIKSVNGTADHTAESEAAYDRWKNREYIKHKKDRKEQKQCPK